MTSINQTAIPIVSPMCQDACSSSEGCCRANTLSAARNFGKTIWQKVEPLRKGDALVIGTQITAFLGVATLGSWAAYAFSSQVPISCPLTASVLTAALAKFYGGSDGAMKVFSDYFPESLKLTRSALKPMPKAGPTGIWQGAGIDAKWSQFVDSRLAMEISKLCTERGIASAWDFGCGSDPYSKVLVQNGIRCSGIEGSPELAGLSGGTALVQDLALPFAQEKRDCVISLEVGGKIPEQYADQFLKNIDAHAKNMIIISWPIKGQRGPNQLNCQNNDYVIEKLGKLGWKLEDVATRRLREGSHPIHYWFQNTAMVFVRNDLYQMQ